MRNNEALLEFLEKELANITKQANDHRKETHSKHIHPNFQVSLKQIKSAIAKIKSRIMRDEALNKAL